MTESVTRRQLLQRTAAGSTALALPGLLAACGGGIKSAAQSSSTSAPVKTVLAKRIAKAVWTLRFSFSLAALPTLIVRSILT